MHREILDILAHDASETIRHEVAKNLNADWEILAELVDDESSAVARAAACGLERVEGANEAG